MKVTCRVGGVLGVCFGISSVLLWATSSLGASYLGQRDLLQLNSDEISAFSTAVDPVKNIDFHNPDSHLSKILIPRAPGSENITFVRAYIVSTLKSLNWEVEEDTFTDNTPYGPKTFTNIIATKDPSAARRVILSAHYDSKFFESYPESQFVGATDSAAPCAMMLDVAEALNKPLEQRKERFENGLEDDDDVAETTLQLVFFDGEEAFKDWTDTDSIYGARHLAKKWSSTFVPPNTKRRLIGQGSMTELATIEHLILLDLLGAPTPSIKAYFPDTAWLFDAMASAERQLAESGALYEVGATDTTSWKSFFLPRTGTDFSFGYIGDDHVPFLQRGVNILHIITLPFPTVWHTLKDDASALDIPTMRRWNLILRIFMAQYLNLRPDDSAIHSHVSRLEGEL
ncbi:hypothetical protein CONPUDRAFT_97283 [Coniophora puteana RWD-64-598 SS2]|uniref:Peptide hydrolase n=1 Tax=Coniophora puteana (strain RWD-64-598) TaxID=741705 RepID=A0A5M3N0G5_CONPW|nr:uncharacterized protein CONPUDRAFT_97283 [Coniophora puteana RWD-64-598 SS2]EIW84879.1 hypothetical protein CONPUDRAFT_97283 [Coniophora puteana RWD-64-598 SS2]